MFRTLLAVAVIGSGSLHAEPPAEIAKFFAPPPELANDFGSYRSPLLFDDGRKVSDAAGWANRRQEIRKYWNGLMGEWPAEIEKPKVEILNEKKLDGYTRQQLRLEVAPGRTYEDVYLLTPKGDGPFPAVVVVFYDGLTGIGENKGPFRDFAKQLALRGFITLSLGSPPESYYPNKEKSQLQPLSYHAYVAANCRNALANMPNVDAKRIGIVGHSYGGKWAMFAACLNDKFTCGAWSDPGIVFDEKRGNVNYWERWYLGYEPGKERKPGIPSAMNPRTGAYRTMVEQGHDLHELHVLMAPRPFFVSGGAEDPVERWKALNHSLAVNRLLGANHRVAMTIRPKHEPNEESNGQMYRFFEYVLKP